VQWHVACFLLRVLWNRGRRECDRSGDTLPFEGLCHAPRHRSLAVRLHAGSRHRCEERGGGSQNRLTRRRSPAARKAAQPGVKVSGGSRVSRALCSHRMCPYPSPGIGRVSLSKADEEGIDDEKGSSPCGEGKRSHMNRCILGGAGGENCDSPARGYGAGGAGAAPPSHKWRGNTKD